MKNLCPQVDVSQRILSHARRHLPRTVPLLEVLERIHKPEGLICQPARR